MHTSSALAFSSTGKYLAVAWTDGSLRVWDLTPSSSSTSTDPFSQQPLLVGSSSVSADSPVVSLNWSSTENALYAFTSKGYIAKWNDPVPSHRPSPFVTMTSTTTSSSANNTPSTPLNQPSPPSSTSISTTSTNVDERKIVNDVGSDSVDHAAQATEVVSRSNVADLMRDKVSFNVALCYCYYLPHFIILYLDVHLWCSMLLSLSLSHFSFLVFVGL